MSRQKTAEHLLRLQAVKLSPDKPFTWASGWKSPIYCDNRKLLSFPFEREFIKSELCSIIFEKFPDAETIAGVATGAIAWGAMVADQLKYPFIYVRPKPKEHGLGKQVEGGFAPGQKVVVVEDLVSTGKSSLQACEALRTEQMQILGMVSLFSYGFLEASEAFEKAGVPLYSLTGYEDLLAVANAKKIVSNDQLKSLAEWRKSPSTWGIGLP